MLQLQPDAVVDVISKGGVIAYPTEAVFGLGCDPDNEIAIQKLLDVKQRPWQKGLILIASHYEQLANYVDESQLTSVQLEFVLSKWPGPFTFVMPIKSNVSSLLCGEFSSIAVRVSAHPTVRALCDTLHKPLVSTSANLAGESPAMQARQILTDFNGKIDALVVGALGEQRQPSTIIDARTGHVIRNGN